MTSFGYLFGQQVTLCDDADIKVKSDDILLASINTRIHHLILESKIKGISTALILGVPTKICHAEAIVAMHGFSSSPRKIMGLEENDYSNSIGLEFVKAGYLVAAPFVFNHGERLSSVGAFGVTSGCDSRGDCVSKHFFMP